MVVNIPVRLALAFERFAGKKVKGDRFFPLPPGIESQTENPRIGIHMLVLEKLAIS